MAMTSEELAQDIQDIDRLIAALSAPGNVDLADPDDLDWLLERRRSISDLLALRRAQKGKKIVSLAVWRYGRATEPEQLAGIG